MKKHFAILAILALIGIGQFQRGDAATDSWSGKAEQSICFSQAITAGTLATVATAVTGKCHNVRAVVVTNTASGFVRLYSTSTLTGANLIGAVGVIANTPLVLTEDSLGAGICTRVGEALCVDATTGTVSLQLRDRLDIKSPKQ